jgi:hypothetical protein
MSLDNPKTPEERKKRLFLWVAMLSCLLGAGTAFAYKIAEFIYTISSEEVRGFADVPITVYFAVAAGWLCLLSWCFLSGKFSDLEGAKLEMLAREDEYERRGI